jgi:hypothetical protein
MRSCVLAMPLILLDNLSDFCSCPHFNPRIEEQRCTVKGERRTARLKEDKERKKETRKSLILFYFFSFSIKRCQATPLGAGRGGEGVNRF